MSNITLKLTDDFGKDYLIELELIKGRPATWNSPPEPSSWSVLSIMDTLGNELNIDRPPGWSEEKFEKWIEEELSWIEREAEEVAI